MNATADFLVDPPAFTPRQKWVALAVALIVLAVFFRQQILNHFSLLSSDRYDGVIAVALLEHWFNALRGLSDWMSPNYFFPYEKTLVYNEGFFIYGLIYSGFRLSSVDPFLSGELVNVVVKAIGFFGFLVAARQMLKLSFWWSLLGAAIFTLGNGSFVQGVHAQLLSVALAPVEAALLYASWQALTSARKLRFFILGSLSALLFSAWMLTCLYTAWFFVLFLAITVCVQLCIEGKPGIDKLKTALSINKVGVLAVAAIGAVSLLPFGSVYLAGQQVQRQRSWGEILGYGPSLLDSINVGTGNLLFGDLVEWVKGWCSVCDIGAGEREAGIAPILFLLAGICIVGIIRRKIALPAQRKTLVGSIAIACAVAWLLSLRFGHFSGWFLVYKFWPGGGGLRVVSRIFLFLALPVTGLAVWYLSQMASRWRREFVLLLCALLILEEINGMPVAWPVTWLDRALMLERTNPVQKPPRECRSFFVTESPDSMDGGPSFVIGALHPHNVDAMLIAERVNLRTINGIASFNPPDWDFGYPTRSDYPLRVERYAKNHKLTGLCRLDLTTLQWDANPKFVATGSPLGFWDFAANEIPSDALEGFSPAETFGRWSIGHKASFKYALAEQPQRPARLRITVAAVLMKGGYSQRLRVAVNGGRQREFLFATPGPRNVDLELPAASGSRGEIDFEFPDAIAPRDLKINGDPRQLAIGVKSIEIR